MDAMKVVNAKGFDFKELKVQCKAMNDAGILDKKINVIGKKPDIVERFIASIDSIPEGDPREKKLPDIAVTLYNAYVEVIDASEDQPIDLVIGTSEESVGSIENEVVKEKEKKEKKEKKESSKEKDEFGFGIGTYSNLFVESLKKSPKTMKEIKIEKWNKSNGTFYNIWKSICKLGKGEIVDGKMALK